VAPTARGWLHDPRKAPRSPRGLFVAVRGRQTGEHQRAGLWWYLVTTLDMQGHHIIEVPPATLKRYATGRGNATKADMRMAPYRRTGIDQPDDNLVDAAWLRHLGLDLLGAPEVRMPEAHRAALGKLADQLTWRAA